MLNASLVTERLSGPVIGLGFVTAGPALEARFFPVRLDQSIHLVERDGHRLCWMWRSMKVRPLASDDIDVFIRIGDEPDRMVGSVFLADTGMPWRKAAAVAMGLRSPRLCTLLPPFVTPAHKVTVEQIVFYPGFLGLYRFPSRIPDVISPGVPPAG